MTCLRRAEPGAVPDREPFALTLPGSRGLIIKALNAAAVDEGLVPGMALADARAAVPRLKVRPANPAAEAQALFKLSQWAIRYGPSRNHDDMSGVWCDVTGVSHLFGGEMALLEDLLGRLATAGIPARAAIADTYGAAHACARFAVARDGGLRIVATGDTRAALSSLPVAALRLDAGVTLLLRRLGLKRIGDLYPIARISLAHRFSSKEAAQRVLQRLDQALGLREEPLRPLQDPAHFSVRRAFAEPLITSGPLEAILAGMCEEMAQHLKDKDMGARRMRLVYFRTDGTAGETGFATRASSNDAAHFIMLLGPRLETIDAGFGIDLITLDAIRTGPCTSPQQGFSEGSAAACDPGPLIDSLSNRLGAQGVSVLRLSETHIPERSEIHVPALHAGDAALKGSGEMKSADKKDYVPPWPYGRGVRRPPFLLERPEPIDVVAQVPDGPPARFTWRRVERRVARAQGPERIAPEWWRLIGRAQTAKPVRTRDYYEIEDEMGAAYWVFRHGLYCGGEDEAEGNAPPPSWYLHGLF